MGTPTVTIREITSLDHELADDAVESRAFIAKALFTSCKGPEVLRRLGNGLPIKANHDPANLFFAVGDIKVNLNKSVGGQVAELFDR